MAPISKKRNSDFYIEKKIDKPVDEDFGKEIVLDRWYINKNRKLLTHMISWYHHGNLIKLSPELNVGHEIYGLFIITKSSKNQVSERGN
jgi:hypothetical protein